jgi:peptidoglycan/xylan/chitin deacetylase (PgdA/CDA1 family)
MQDAVYRTICLTGSSKPARHIPILAYHSIDESPSEVALPEAMFRSQIEFLKERQYVTIGLDDLLEHLKDGSGIRRRAVVITFDDGFKSTYERAFPILRENGFTATIFLTAHSVGSRCNWLPEDSLLSQMPMLDWEEIAEMQHHGFRFGAHSLTHPCLTSLTREEAEEEIRRSKEYLEEKLQTPIRFFCYPYGYFDAGTMELVARCGYFGACTMLFGTDNAFEDRYKLKRIILSRDDPRSFLRAVLTDGFNRWRRMVRMGKRLLSMPLMPTDEEDRE